MDRKAPGAADVMNDMMVCRPIDNGLKRSPHTPQHKLG
jgi:hypothetical protein